VIAWARPGGGLVDETAPRQRSSSSARPATCPTTSSRIAPRPGRPRSRPGRRTSPDTPRAPRPQAPSSPCCRGRAAASAFCTEGRGAAPPPAGRGRRRPLLRRWRAGVADYVTYLGQVSRRRRRWRLLARGRPAVLGYESNPPDGLAGGAWPSAAARPGVHGPLQGLSASGGPRRRGAGKSTYPDSPLLRKDEWSVRRPRGTAAAWPWPPSSLAGPVCRLLLVGPADCAPGSECPDNR
jgi:hypothetical protein